MGKVGHPGTEGREGAEQRKLIHFLGNENRDSPVGQAGDVLRSWSLCRRAQQPAWHFPTGAENLRPQKTFTSTFIAAFLSSPKLGSNQGILPGVMEE